MQEESGLFQVTFNEKGKRYIRKFASLSYTMLVLILFESAISIYWNVKMLLVPYTPATGATGNTILYEETYYYISIFFSLINLVSNFYFLRFPRALSRSIGSNDEVGANNAFRLLWRSALIFFLSLIISTAQLLWSLTIPFNI